MSHALPALLITRPLEAAARLAKAVRAEADVAYQDIISPLLKIEATGKSIVLDQGDVAIFTSVNGVEQAHFQTPISGQTAYCVGDRTAQIANDRGFAVVSATGTAQDLLSLILLQKNLDRIVHIRGEQTRVDLVSELRQSGIIAEESVAYRQLPDALTAEASEQMARSSFVVVPLFSPNTARAFAAQPLVSNAIITVAMSAAVDAELHEVPRLSSLVARHPDQKSMVASICSALRGNSGATGP